ncbi:HNH endonuclease [Adhaeribacter aquaticus]|uniref:HNH endonuclease n=1 Tax=Adhaeribacter aquaticus TaxID=299567 RepID=UPI000478854D|nr:HNH endonuclease [Adhaeribacter aquaticus]
MAHTLWSRDELILALNLYLKLPFGKISHRTPEVIHLSNLIGRTANSISMRLSNFASVDPYHQQRGVGGLPGGKKQVEPIWNEFITRKEDLLFESERILAEKENQTLENKFSTLLTGTEVLEGKVKVREVKTRVNQYFFRQMVMANFNFTCAITGISVPDLLIASHIVPWSKNEKERLNPENGLCLSPLYDKAFDKGLIGINTDFKIKISKELKKAEKASFFNQYFGIFEMQSIQLPKKYLPKKEFLEYHSDVIFKHS